MTPETRLVNQMVRKLKALKRQGHPIWWLKIHGSPMQRAGVPDLLICFGGRFVAIEVKTPEGKVTRLQKHTIEQIKAADGGTYVCRSVLALDEVLSTY